MIAHTLVAGIPQHVVTVGRGFHYGTAFEIALKIRELAGVFTEAFSPADLRHGPIAAVRPGTPVFLIAPRGAVHEDMTELLSDLRQRRAAVWAISDDEDVLANRPLLPYSFPAGVAFAVRCGCPRAAPRSKPR